ncbi:MAG TPA: hypothetical protein PKC40_08975, partial [Saprospiraceae bacterium]|nr:hypothetical protein [Saprospiraceae bacterium]
MKQAATLFLLLFFGTLANAQILQPVKWSFDSKSLGNDEFDLIFTATIKEGWTIYSQFTSDDGPVPTSFEFDPGRHFERNGGVLEKGKK